MSRKAVRNAAAAFFAPPAVNGFNTVYTGEPRDVPVNAYLWQQPAGTKTGAIGFFFIEHQRDQLEIMQGSPVQGRWVRYEVGMAVRVRSLQAKAQDALDDHDDILDAIVARLRSDPTLGGTVWQAGTGDWQGGKDDIEVNSGLPKPITKGGPIVIWSAIRFKAIEVL